MVLPCAGLGCGNSCFSASHSLFVQHYEDLSSGLFYYYYIYIYKTGKWVMVDFRIIYIAYIYIIITYFVDPFFFSLHKSVDL